MPKVFKYDIGDRVKVTNIDGVTKGYDVIGKTGVIEELKQVSTFDYRVKFDDGSVSSSLRESELTKLNEYIPKIGDLVRLKTTGEEGIIVTIDNEHNQAEMRFNSNPNLYQVYGFNKYETVENGEVDMNIVHKFKVGDKVLTKTDDHWNGKIGEIIKLDGSPTNPGYDVKFENSESCFDERELELVESMQTEGYFQQLGNTVGELVDQKQLAYGDSVSKTYKLMQIFLEQYDNGDDTYTIPKSLLKHILLQVRKIDKANRIFSNPDGDLMGENPYQDDVGYSLLGMRMVEGGE